MGREALTGGKSVEPCTEAVEGSYGGGLLESGQVLVFTIQSVESVFYESVNDFNLVCGDFPTEGRGSVA